MIYVLLGVGGDKSYGLGTVGQTAFAGSSVVEGCDVYGACLIRVNT